MNVNKKKNVGRVYRPLPLESMQFQEYRFTAKS
jgi:hypothetical protein